MSISDDEYDSRQGFDQENHNAALSKAELRKTNKPIMEKKRRARINQCLGELKDLILEAMKKDPSRHSKLEKADILEMTVRHLQSMQRRGLAAAASTDPEVLPRFRQGFADCAAEATRFLSKPPALPAPARSRLRQHLAACVAALHQPQQPNMPHDLNGNISVGGVPLIPSRLPTGELALVVPAGAQLPFNRSISDLFAQKDHLSAFQSVRGPNRPPSPASSISSCDSMSSDRGTPPHGSISNAFPTPPSQTSSFNESSPETQKQVVSSTTISPETRPEVKQPERQKGSLWRQCDVVSPNKAAVNHDGSKFAIDYSTTPVTGKRKMYAPNNIMNAPMTPEPPCKVPKTGCTQVSSSQSPEDVFKVKNNVEIRPPRAEQGKDAAGTSGTQASNDMWRPW